MDASVSIENSKRQKASEEQCNHENEDRISNLPETVLHYVLSFAPMELAVRTSILSTSWKHLWASIHNLDFDDGMEYATKKVISSKKKDFFDFVDRVLCINAVSNINRFSLKCQDYDAIRLGKWISIAMERKVQELIIYVQWQRNRIPYRFPACVFACESLRVLKIDMKASINLPAAICFSSLRILHLTSIALNCNHSKETSLSCPVLRELCLYYCRWLEFKVISIFAPTLERLTIVEPSGLVNLRDRMIKIDAKNLISFMLRGEPFYEYTLCNQSNLVVVYLELSGYSPDDAIVRNLSAVLKGISNVKDLELYDSSISTLSYPPFPARMHELSNLVHLRVRGGSICTNGKLLIDLLCNMPNIETLSFPKGLVSFGFQGNGRILGRTPKSFLSRLKLVNIHSFGGTQNQRWFIKFLIKSVKTVAKWTIIFPKGIYQPTVVELEKLAEGSNCVLQYQLKGCLWSSL